MKVLLAVCGSVYTKRMLSFLAAHDELLSPRNAYAVMHGVLAVPSRAAASFIHSIGHPSEAIAHLAEEGRFGSVATQVLAKCSVPVLLIR